MIKGFAKFINQNSIGVKNNGVSQINERENFIIATVSRPQEYSGIPVDRKLIFNSDNILNLEKFPERIIIIIGSVIIRL